MKQYDFGTNFNGLPKASVQASSLHTALKRLGECLEEAHFKHKGFNSLTIVLESVWTIVPRKKDLY